MHVSPETRQEPKIILSVFRKIENNCVTLMQHNHKLGEELKVQKEESVVLQDAIEKKLAVLHSPVKDIKKAIVKEQNNIAALVSMIRQIQEQQSMDNQGEMIRVGNKIEEVYKKCVGELIINIGVETMLSGIEETLFRLLETMKMFPLEKLEAAEKAKHKEEIRRKREEKLEALKQRSFHRSPQQQ